MSKEEKIPVQFIKDLAQASEPDRATLELLLKLWETHEKVCPEKRYYWVDEDETN